MVLIRINIHETHIWGWDTVGEIVLESDSVISTSLKSELGH